MKLLNLRLANLNSLYGEWSIDFEHRDFVANGLFAITGPTGAGKSTLLDAIALALYGRTPRLGTISNTANEIMSRDCGECFAEVTFQSSKGTFRAHWSQRRARSKAIGNLQAPQHELTDAMTQRVVTAKKLETLSTIQDYVGLDYEQFMRSIMLAQGEFATFLKSEDSKRAAILAKITGTDIYAKIGTAVYQRFRSESDSLDVIAIQSSAIELLSEDAIVKLNGQIQEIDRTLEQLKESRSQTDLSLRWFERLEQLQQEIANLREEGANAKLSVDASRSLRNRYARAQKAMPLQRTLEGFRTLQCRIESAKEMLAEKRGELAEAESTKNATVEQLDKAKYEMTALQMTIDRSRPVWLTTHDLDLQIGNAQANLEKTQEQAKSTDLHRQRLQQEKLDSELKSKVTRDKLAENLQYQTDNHFDAELVSLLPKIEHLIAEFQSTIDSMRIAESKGSSITDEMATTKADLSAVQARFLSANRAVEESQLQIEALEKRRLSTLDGSSVDALQAEAESARSARQAMLEHVRLVESVLALETELKSESEEIDRLKKAILEDRESLARMEKHTEQQKQLVDALEASHFKDKLIAQLHEHRARLVAGQPCELCGSTNHPWAEGAIPKAGDSEQALNIARISLAQYTQEYEAANRIADRNAHLLSQAVNTMDDLKESLRLSIADCEQHATQFRLDSQIDTATADLGKQSIDRLKESEARVSERIRDANSLLEQIAKSQEELTKLVASKATAEHAVQALENSHRNLEESRQRTESDVSKHCEGLRMKREELTKIFERLGLTWPEDLVTTHNVLQKRSLAWLASVEVTGELEKNLLLNDRNIANLTTQIEQLDKAWNAIQAILNTQLAELEGLQRRRIELFGSQSPEAAEHELHMLLLEKDADVKRLTAELEPKVVAWQLLDRQALQIDSSLTADVELSIEQKKQLDIDLQLAGFLDLLELESAIKTELEIEEWMRQLQSIDEAWNASNIRLSQKEIELETWLQKRSNEVPLDLLQQQLSETDGRIGELSRERMELEHRLTENQAKAAQLQGTQVRLANQQRQAQRWGVLNELIGSADGTKFRRFAQGITFELLLAYANIQLTKLTDRYLLKKGEEGLSLVVIDHYQSSRPRSAANLSGGETFLVSLALALGLSKLASQNVQIDSLFLDEGFGTLDEETLDEALHTLANLRQEGKLVGLISHVAALNQQVPVRIEVVKGSMGRSRLVGPGVKPPRHS